MIDDYRIHLEKVLGRKGRLVSGSKSCGPAMAIFNANVVVDGELVWHGDVDVEASGPGLMALAEILHITIEIYYESALRVWKFDTTTDAEYSKSLADQKTKIDNKTGLVWSTDDPEKWGNEIYAEAKVVRQKMKDENIRQRQIAYGLLTPWGGEWRWWNRWFFHIIWSKVQKYILPFGWAYRYAKHYRKDGWGVVFRSWVKELAYHFDIKRWQDIEIFKKSPAE